MNGLDLRRIRKDDAQRYAAALASDPPAEAECRIPIATARPSISPDLTSGIDVEVVRGSIPLGQFMSLLSTALPQDPPRNR
jgi:hypothetical protein